MARDSSTFFIMTVVLAATTFLITTPRIRQCHSVAVSGSSGSCSTSYQFGNESNDSILEAYGIIPKDKRLSNVLKPKHCPSCNEPNKPDSKFCTKCRMVLTYDAYSETLESEKQKKDKLTVMEEQFNSMQSQLQSLLIAVTNMNDQNKVNEFAKTLFNSGLVKKDYD
jgi:predicted nucleic acid-binding Zn ribbon protein